MTQRPPAAVLAVGSELASGLRSDTNGAEVARELTARGYRVVEVALLPDELGAVSSAVKRAAASCDVVVVTGGLGPTHDDVTREAVADALGLPLETDPGLEAGLAVAAARHDSPETRKHMLRQAQVLGGARILTAMLGTAPGQVVDGPRGLVALLPGPPAEMRPMLADLLGLLPASGTAPVVLGCTGLYESDAQALAEKALAGREGVTLGVLARPGQVDVLLFDGGGGPDALAAASRDVRAAVGEKCFSDDGAPLAEVVLRLAREAGATLSAAESCTGGMIGASLTDVPGSSEVFLGSAVAYSNGAKTALLGVSEGALARHGAVSEQVAVEMARGAREAFGTHMAVSTTGIAGPGGGTPEKPVGSVWIGLADSSQARAEHFLMPGSRDAIRARATAIALDLLRGKLR